MRKSDRFLFATIFITLLCVLSTPAPANADLITKVLAPAYVLLDVETGRVLAARAEHERRFPASTTKTMTALLAVESGDIDRLVTIGPNPPKIGESSIYVQLGETFMLRELVEAAMIKSANDSCVAIAEAVAGSEAEFVKKMNNRARALGAKNTHFRNSHGLHDTNHYSTAYDLALIARAALQHPVLNEIIATKDSTIHGHPKVGAVRLLKNRNRLLFRWDECDGVKTGYTRQAGRCLIASATRVDPISKRPWRLLSVVLHAPDSWTDSRNLLEHGFAKYAPTVVVRGGETLATIDVQGGSSPVQAVASKEIRLPLRDFERNNLSPRVRSLKPEAPIERDQVVAQLEWFLGERKIGEVPLVARDAVDKSLMAKVIPAAAHVVPSKPIARWSVYFCATLGILFVGLGLKVRANERRREWERERRRAARRLIG